MPNIFGKKIVRHCILPDKNFLTLPKILVNTEQQSHLQSNMKENLLNTNFCQDGKKKKKERKKENKKGTKNCVL